MRMIKSTRLRWLLVLAPILVMGPGLMVVVAQYAVSQAASAPPAVQSQSVRYGGGSLLPSERRYARSQSGLLPSEYRNARWASGSLPSQGMTGSVRYSGYNQLYNRTANSMAPAYNSYKQLSTGYTPSIRYGGTNSSYRNTARPTNTYVNRNPSGGYHFHQNYNSYNQVSTRSSSFGNYKPSIRYNHIGR